MHFAEMVSRDARHLRFFCSKFSMKNSPEWLNGTRLDAKRSLFDVISVGTVIVRANSCGEQGFVHNKAGSFTKFWLIDCSAILLRSAGTSKTALFKLSR